MSSVFRVRSQRLLPKNYRLNYHPARKTRSSDRLQVIWHRLIFTRMPKRYCREVYFIVMTFCTPLICSTRRLPAIRHFFSRIVKSRRRMAIFIFLPSITQRNASHWLKPQCGRQSIYALTPGKRTWPELNFFIAAAPIMKRRAPSWSWLGTLCLTGQRCSNCLVTLTGGRDVGTILPAAWRRLCSWTRETSTFCSKLPGIISNCADMLIWSQYSTGHSCCIRRIP